MRWQQLFEDLQSQFEAEEAALERAESASRTRAEVGAVRLTERLAGALGFQVGLGVRGAGHVAGLVLHRATRTTHPVADVEHGHGAEPLAQPGGRHEGIHRTIVAHRGRCAAVREW